MEGLDIRTLALTNILLGVFLGVGSLVFARIHPSFRGFKALGYSYFLFSFGFILLGLRQYISDLFSIIVANSMIFFGFSLLIVGILRFLKYDKKTFEKISLILVCGLIISFVYFTYIQSNVNFRIIIISIIIAGQSFFIGFKVLIHQEKSLLTFNRFLGFSFFYCAVIFLCRAYFAISEPTIDNFMDAGIIHALSLIALQFVVITSCFSLTLGASQQLANKLAIQATIDSLTQLYNRRAFDEFAEKGVMRAQREKTPISLILMDIDLFKEVNDNYGHQVGDKVLQEFSLRLKNSLRQYDVLARYGGEEFTLLLPDTNAATAMIIAEKLRNKIAEPVFFLEGETDLSITASFGVATNQGEDINWQQLISFADQALYHAKEDGRNCAKLHSADVLQMTKVEKRH